MSPREIFYPEGAHPEELSDEGSRGKISMPSRLEILSEAQDEQSGKTTRLRK